MTELARFDNTHWEVVQSRWYRFVDINGNGLCQPDLEVHLVNYIVCVECKLSQTENAHSQMRELYQPVLEKVYKKPVYCIQATPTLIYPPDLIVHNIAEFINKPSVGKTVWHFRK